jgi:hypothetical protein
MNIKLNIKSTKSNSSSQFNIPVLSAAKHTTDNVSQPRKGYFLEHCLSPLKTGLFRQVVDTCRNLVKKSGVHSTIVMYSAGFHYIGNADTARCDSCGLEVSGWTLNMKPFTVHAQRSPTCPFVLSLLPTGRTTVPSMLTLTSDFSTLIEEERPCKRQKTETPNKTYRSCVLAEVDILKQIRRRTFLHWPHQKSPMSTQMIEAGFFNCNIGDRAICLYCNLICQQWIPNTDDPWKVHKTLSPKCPYIIAMLKCQQTPLWADANKSQENQEVQHKAYAEANNRYVSFATWPNKSLPSVDNLVRAGFFYIGTKTTVTCFHCNGSLDGWGPSHNPLIEHVRWFPHCAYAKRLCGAELHRKIQEQKRCQPGIADFLNIRRITMNISF